jgi:hypothetical protein
MDGRTINTLIKDLCVAGGTGLAIILAATFVALFIEHWEQIKCWMFSLL